MQRRSWLWLFVVPAIFFLAACGGGGSSSTSDTGAVQMSLTDSPAGGEMEETFDNVIITVTDIWFHMDNTVANPADGGWLKYHLASPTVVDLAHLTDGALSQVLNKNLPVGTYRQIRLLLASTEDNVVTDNTVYQYNNEVVWDNNGTPVTSPLRIPDAFHGIALYGSFTVSSTAPLHLAVDFNISNDVVRYTRHRNGVDEEEFFLKPRLRYFDLDNVGSITGQLSYDNSTSHYFVIKAEQRDAGDSVYTVKRFTGMKADNTFVLSFLRPGTYDIMIRGRNTETVIVRGVTVTKGQSTPILASGTIPVQTGTFHTANTSVSPTGAWVNFYQTLDNNATGATTEYPYEIRYRHLDPYTGHFHNPIPLSNGPIHFGTYNTGNAITFQSITPKEGLSGFLAIADAIYFQRSAPVAFDNTTAGPVFSSRLAVGAGFIPYTVSGSIFIRNRWNTGFSGMTTLDNVVIFITHGGMLVDTSLATPPAMSWTMGSQAGNTYTTGALPGGFPGAFYGIDGFGWGVSAGHADLAIGMLPAIADLRTGNDNAANFNMRKIF
jgi:hypothetical protein